jgi:hypothetical protein
MNSNEIRKGKEDIQLKNNAIVNRMMAMFVLATVAVVALLMIKKNGGATERAFVLDWLIYFKIAGGVLLAGAIAFFAFRRKKGVDESLKVFSSTALLIIAIIVFSVFMLYQYFGNTAMVVLVIASLVLSFVYNFYQKDYYYYSIFTVAAVLFMYFLRSGISGIIWKNILYFISCGLIFIVPIGICLILMRVKSNNGKLKLGKNINITMKPSYLYYPFFVGAIIAVIGGLVGLIFASYLIYIMVAQLAAYLLFGIIYTIKMI